jgi:enediyne biosynthesis protein E4
MLSVYWTALRLPPLSVAGDIAAIYDAPMLHKISRLTCISALALILNAGAAPEPQATFTVEDFSARAGLTFSQNNFATEAKYPFETMGGGVAAFDFNNDGYLDLLFLNGAPSPSHIRSNPESFNRLYKNNGPGMTFTDVTESSGLSGRGIAGYPQGVATGDYDNDGYEDICVTNFGDNVLYHNNGDGTFTDVTARAGVAMKGHPFKASACWVDVDNDGFLDLFVTHYFDWTFEEHADYYCGDRKPGFRSYCRPEVFKALPNVLFRNNGDGTFTDISRESGIAKYPGKGMGVAIADYDSDGWMDILVVNDKASNFLYHNKGQGAFEEVALKAGIWANEYGQFVSGMGCDFKDVNNDGMPDIFYTDLVTECFTLFINHGRGIFSDRTFPSGLGPLTSAHSGWSTRFLDWDNDGWKDILVAGSHVLDNSELYSRQARYKEPCFFYRNLGNGRFEDASKNLGADFQMPGAYRGLAVGDFNNDGELEAATSRLNDRCVFFKKKSGPSGNWLIVTLKGTRSNRDAIGARVAATLRSGLVFYEHVSTANGIYSASDKRVHLGLGKESVVAVLQITWPSGTVQTIENVQANQVLQISEPEK